MRGIGDASGMFPIDIATGRYDAGMLAQFDQLAAQAGVELRLAKLLPDDPVRPGRRAVELTAAGARLLDPTERLHPGSPTVSSGG